LRINLQRHDHKNELLFVQPSGTTSREQQTSGEATASAVGCVGIPAGGSIDEDLAQRVPVWRRGKLPAVVQKKLRIQTPDTPRNLVMLFGDAQRKRGSESAREVGTEGQLLGKPVLLESAAKRVKTIGLVGAVGIGTRRPRPTSSSACAIPPAKDVHGSVQTDKGPPKSSATHNGRQEVGRVGQCTAFQKVMIVATRLSFSDSSFAMRRPGVRSPRVHHLQRPPSVPKVLRGTLGLSRYRIASVTS